MKKEEKLGILYTFFFISTASFAMLLSVCDAFTFSYQKMDVYLWAFFYISIVSFLCIRKKSSVLLSGVCIIGELFLAFSRKEMFQEHLADMLESMFVQWKVYFSKGSYAEITPGVDQTDGLLAMLLIVVTLSGVCIRHRKKKLLLGILMSFAFFLPFFIGNRTGKLTLFYILLTILGVVCEQGNHKNMLARICIVGAALGIGILCLENPLKDFLNTTTAMQKKIEGFWNGEIRDWLKTDANAEVASGGVNNGELGKYSELKQDNQVQLTVTVNEKPEKSLYLRGFVGNSYTGHSWRKSDEKDFGIVSNWIQIKNVEANRKYQYHPYPKESELPDEWKKKDSYYETSVRNKYLYVPNATSKVFEETVAQRVLRENPEYIAWEIRTLLSEQAQYSLMPGKTPMGKDFAEYFFFENKKGYCTHFATTATLLFRMKGIPSRYIAGYVVDANAFVKQEDGSFLAEVTGEDAHAWAEIYVAGKGWIPVETTPGYESFYEIQQENITPQESEGEQKKPAQAEAPEKKPDVPKKSGQTKPQEENGKKNEGIDHSEKREEKTNWKMLVGVVILVMGCMIFSRFCIQVSKKKKQTLTYRELTKQDFYKIHEILVAKKIVGKEEELDDCFVEKIEKQYPQLKVDLHGILEIVYRANYGEKEVSKEEYLLVRRLRFLLEKKA